MFKAFATTTAFCLLGVTAAHAQATNCGNAGNMVEIGSCMAKAYERADGQLNTGYREVIAHIEDYLAYDPTLAEKAVDNVRAAQRAWITTRDNDCNAAGLAASGGSLESINITECLILTTRARIDALYILKDFFRP